MRPPRPVQRFVAPQGAPLKVPVLPSACVPPTQYSVSWPRREPRRRSQCYRLHASRPPPCTALRGPIESPTEAPETVRMRPGNLIWHFHPTPIESPIEAPSGTVRMRP
eukprot:7199642-Pyramimonas_sp.AAC.1